MSGLPGFERRTMSLQYFAGTDVEWVDLIEQLEADPPSSPAAFLAEHPAVSREHLLIVLRGMAEAMAYEDAWRSLRFALDVDASDPIAEGVYSYHCRLLERRAVVEAWRDALAEAERAAEDE